MMNLSPAYLHKREQLLEQSRRISRQEERRLIVENVLLVRFGLLDKELANAIASLIKLPSDELSHVLLTLSREELLQRFSK